MREGITYSRHIEQPNEFSMEVRLTCTTSLDVSHSSGGTPSFVRGLSLDARIYSLYCFELQH